MLGDEPCVGRDEQVVVPLGQGEPRGVVGPLETPLGGRAAVAVAVDDLVDAVGVGEERRRPPVDVEVGHRVQEERRRDVDVAPRVEGGRDVKGLGDGG